MPAAVTRSLRKLLVATVALVPALMVLPLVPLAADDDAPHVLVFSGTYGFRHPSITYGNATLAQLALETGVFTMELSENPADIRADKLAQVDVVLFNSPTGRFPLSAQQRTEFERWAACGGGVVGVHAAADANYGWAAWAELMGAQFEAHPHNANDGEARLLVEDQEHPTTAPWHGQDELWLEDEYYRWRLDPRGTQDIDVLLSLDEDTANGSYGPRQPLAWAKTFREGGRVFYTNLGHNESTWMRADFRESLVAGIDWVGQVRAEPACLESTDPLPPPQVRAPDAERVPLDRGCEPAEGVEPLATGSHTLEVTPSIAPAYFGVTRHDFVIDLSALADEVEPNEPVEVTLSGRLEWDDRERDYDLAVSSPVGFAGSDAVQPLAPPVEELTLDGLWHCDVVHVDVFTHQSTGTTPLTLDLVVEQQPAPNDPPDDADPPDLPDLPDLPGPPELPVRPGPTVIAPQLGQGIGYLNPEVATLQGGGLYLTNTDLVQHDIVSAIIPRAFASPIADTGEVVEVEGVADLEPGTYDFYCSLHPGMRGVLTVLPLGGPLPGMVR